jgi:hypothetical protein
VKQSLLAFSEKNSFFLKYYLDKLAARFCQQVADWVSDMFCDFYYVKNHKIANCSGNTEAREKISTYLESLEF